MTTNLGLLLLFGMTITSGQFMPRLNQPFAVAIIPRGQSNGCPSGPELAPLICKFMQQNIDLQYKPRLIAPTTNIPPLEVEKCDSPKLEMEIDLPGFIDEKKAVVIPAPPELPPITIPKFPVPVIIQVPPASVEEPRKTADIQETPVVNIPIAPELPPFEMPALPQIIEEPEPQFQEKVNPEIEYNVIDYEPWVVPQAPKLPAFTMPEFPMMPIVVAPCPEDESFTEIPVPELVQELTPVPAAPELPPVQLPSFPVRVEIPAEPILPTIVMPELPIMAVPYFEDQPAPVITVPEHLEPMVPVPAAPELPAFVMPELPIIAVPYFEDQPASVITVPEHLEPMVPVPAAPELPAFVMPELPITAVPSFEDQPAPVITVPEHLKPMVPVPAAPELPAFVMPELPIIAVPYFEDQPAPVITVPEHLEPMVPVPAAPELPAFVMPELPIMAVPYFEDQPAPVITVPEHLEPMVPVPAAPELPAFVLPEFPVRVVELGLPAVPALCPEDETIPELQTSAFIQPLAPIPADPELPPALQLPEFPLRVEIPDGPIFTPSLFIDKPVEEPCLNEVVVPEIDNNYVEYNPISIPQPPKLPTFVMPELPEIVVEQEPPVMAAPCPEDQPAPVVTIPEYIQPLAPMPVAPELRLTSLPEFSIHLENPSGSLLMPNTEKPSLTEELLVPKPEPIIIPQAPKLPKLVMPELPKFEPVALPMPVFAAEPRESSGQPIFKVTAGPRPYLERYFPSSMENLHKIMIPSQPIDPAFFPARCVYDLVMQHVIPNIASDRLDQGIA